MKTPEMELPYKVFQVGGRVFHIYLEYDEELCERYPVYPDFSQCPEYTEGGQPFATAAQESCPHCKPANAGQGPPYDCGGCGWFLRESTPFDPIGVCTCPALHKGKTTDE